METILPLLIAWLAASFVVALVVVLAGSLLELNPPSVTGLVWRAAIAGAVYVGGTYLATLVPVRSASVALPGLGMFLCAHAFFGLEFPEESTYAGAFAVAVVLTMLFVGFTLAIVFDFYAVG